MIAARPAPRRHGLGAAGAALLALLAGCAGDTALRGAPPAAEGELAQYTMHGRFAVRQQEQAASGRISWSRTPDEERVLLQDPFGTGIGELTQRDGAAQLALADGRVFTDRDGEALLARVTGVRVPLGALGVWLTGRGSGAWQVAGLERDASGRVRRFSHDGWQIEYRYRDEVALPAGLSARRDDGAELRLSVDAWELPE